MLVNWVFGQPIAFSLTGLQLDLFQFIYDLLLTALMGFAVWKITSYKDEQRQIRKSFQKEVQSLSSYLDALQSLVELYPDQKCDVAIRKLIALSPRHESFDYLEDGYEALWNLANEERAIQKSISDGLTDRDRFERHGSNIFRIRIQIIRLKLPSGRLKSHSADRLEGQIERAFRKEK